MKNAIHLLAVLFIVAGSSAHAAGTSCGTNLTDNGDGTITDSGTGLTWKKCLEGKTASGSNCTGTATTFTWQNALALTENGWRVPNIKELQSIVDAAKANPAINTACFPTATGSTAIYVWSSSPYAGDTSRSWVIDFKDGKFFNSIPQTQVGWVNVRLVKP